mmetsp:Transcript_9934/g.15022  ORF Transcript_9934/g.15022 Transcript_9934/m.15022 type:complete len:94 (+) Transcript_9934:1781-2062(+)|eukprot:CAMPEP_0170512254 /NCGR_PEP_ID=MMETSP0208-20121228/66750_1 /TAXON_ID=197538 /ORGANISM="Strombidium inclinatum, Strain S3" /LENGTH=93 /DNA_ID=CAMNT_0010795869 /DNA_START=2486 /DNA_END=2767 /DNA_ORIENTATION=-
MNPSPSLRWFAFKGVIPEQGGRLEQRIMMVDDNAMNFMPLRYFLQAANQIPFATEMIDEFLDGGPAVQSAHEGVELWENGGIGFHYSLILMDC